MTADEAVALAPAWPDLVVDWIEADVASAGEVALDPRRMARARTRHDGRLAEAVVPIDGLGLDVDSEAEHALAAPILRQALADLIEA